MKRVRRGRLVDREYLEWVREQICILAWHPRAPCVGVITAHHVKETPGAPKNDRRAVPLCQGHHLHGFGMQSIERLGRKQWEMKFQMDLENVIRNLNGRFEREERR